MLPGGHIHDTYLATYAHAGRAARYIHQRLNQRVFADPPALMDNIRRVTEHVRASLERECVSDIARRVLTVMLTRDGQPVYVDNAGAYWRTYPYIERTRTYTTVASAVLAEQAASAFGRFVQLLADLPSPRLHETIPAFHDTPGRLRRLRQAAAADLCGRTAAVSADVEFALARASTASLLADLRSRGELTERVVHNDTKIANVLFDERTDEAICIVDLDTVMPGLVLHDFGDLVRSSVCAAHEDERNLARVQVRLEVFEGLVRGYLRSAGELLNERERALLPFAGTLVALEAGMRFLTDYLEGDVYFRIRRPQHNLQRARCQFQLVRSLEQQQSAMAAAVERAVRP
jgi:hypothetical protein